MVRNILSRLVRMVVLLLKGLITAALYSCRVALGLLKLFLLLLALVGRIFLAFVKVGTPI